MPLSFDPVARRIAAPVQLIAPALLGHAGGPTQGESFAGEIERLAQLIREQASAPPVVIGYSLGARLALGLAVEHPNDVAALILLSVNPGLRTTAERTARLTQDERLVTFLQQHGTRAFIEQIWQKLPLFASQQTLPESVQATQTAQRMQHEAAGLAHCLQILGLGSMPSYWDALPSLASRVPTTLVTGTLDQKFHRIADEISRFSSKIAWLCAPNVGHNLLLEAPELVGHLAQQALHLQPSDLR